MYNSASEVIREALRLLDEQDSAKAMQIEELRREIKRGIESGESTSLNMKEIKTNARRIHNKSKRS